MNEGTMNKKKGNKNEQNKEGSNMLQVPTDSPPPSSQ